MCVLFLYIILDTWFYGEVEDFFGGEGLISEEGVTEGSKM